MMVPQTYSRRKDSALSWKPGSHPSTINEASTRWFTMPEAAFVTSSSLDAFAQQCSRTISLTSRHQIDLLFRTRPGIGGTALKGSSKGNGIKEQRERRV